MSPEIDLKILLSLDNVSLPGACRVNEYARSICVNDYFWLLKVRQDFGRNVASLKPTTETYNQQYQYLAELPSIVQQIQENRLDALIVSEQLGRRFTVGNANQAADYGRLDIVNWLAQRNILPNVIGANSAARRGRIPILNWLAQRNIFPNVNGADMAAENNQMGVLEWLARYRIFPTVRGANDSATKGHISVLNWLETHGIFPNNPIFNSKHG